ncbi:hypothetical protein F4814DRAFT_450091 [Daldinia grandis]|nr:hypothetical protein F4814DRAFT_450091 [Daldinia grandis]
MKPKETPPPSTPVFRIHVLDAAIEVPIGYDRAEEPRIEDADELDISHQPEHPLPLSSPSLNNDDSNNSYTHTAPTEDHIISPLSRASRFQDDFLALPTPLPVERYPPSPSPTPFSFCSADYFNRGKGDAEKRKDNPSNTRSSIIEDSSQVMSGISESGVILTTEKKVQP